MRLILTLALLLSAPAYAALGTPKDNCILGTTVPAADYTLAAALVVDGRSDKTNFQIANYSDAEVCFCYNAKASSECAGKGTANWCLPAQSTMSRDDVKFGDFVRVVQGGGGAPTTGKVCAGGW